MKAVRMTAVGKPLEMFEIPIPEAGPGEVLVRVRAAGICHSDAHYRAGKSPVRPLPLTLGHEIAGVIEAVGPGVRQRRAGERVCLHYLLACGDCAFCASGSEQFCVYGSMLGHYANGGYAEYIAVPERNAVLLPDEIPFEFGAVLMCSAATSLHALRKARLKGGETLAVFGVGGLGASALQIGRALGARQVFGVDIHPEKLALAQMLGAEAIDARQGDAADEIRRLVGGGVDVALELVGLPVTMQQAVRCLAPMGRAVIAGISDRPLEVNTYHHLIGPEAEIIGSNDHLLQELPLLVELARSGALDLSKVVTRSVALDADAINATLDALERFEGGVRTVIVP